MSQQIPLGLGARRPRKAKKKMSTPTPSQNAIDQVSAALLWMQQQRPKLTRPWLYSLSEKRWRALAAEVSEMGHKLLPILGSCSSGDHLKDAQAATKSARSIVRGRAMPKRRRKKKA